MIFKVLFLLWITRTTLESGLSNETKKFDAADFNQMATELSSSITKLFLGLFRNAQYLTLLFSQQNILYKYFVQEISVIGYLPLLVLSTSTDISHIVTNKRTPGENDVAIIFCENRKSLEHILPPTNKIWWNNRSPFLVILDGSETEKEIPDIFQYLWQKRILRSAVFIISDHIENTTNSNTYVSMYSYNPHVDVIYQNDVPLGFLDKEKEALNQALSTTKANNLHGYTVTLTSLPLNYLPSISHNRKGDGTYTSSGYEVQVLESLRKCMNYTAKYLQRSSLGSKLENGTWVGLHGDLANGQADISNLTTGLIYQRLKIIEYSEYVSITTTSMVVPKAEKLPTWLSLLLLYKPSVWYSIIATFIIVGSVIVTQNAVIALGEKKHDCCLSFLSIAGILLEASVTLPNSNTQRITFFVWIYFCLVVTALYEGGIVSILTVPRYYPDIGNVRDLANSKLTLSGFSFYRKVLSATTDPYLKSLLERLEVSGNYDFLMDSLIRFKKIAIIGASETLHYYSSKTNLCTSCTESYHFLAQTLGIQARAFPVPRGSPLLHRFNVLIRRMRESGLISKWYEDVKMYSGGKSSCKNSCDGKVVQISLDNLKSVFYLLGFGLLVSFVVFVIELVRRKKNC